MSLPKFISVEDYISYFTEHVLVLQKLRKIILNTSPEISERMRYNCPFYDYLGMMLFLAVQHNKVVIGFVEGKLLSDEAAAFIPSDLKQVRHLQFISIKDVNTGIIVPYIREAMLVQELKKKQKM